MDGGKMGGREGNKSKRLPFRLATGLIYERGVYKSTVPYLSLAAPHVCDVQFIGEGESSNTLKAFLQVGLDTRGETSQRLRHKYPGHC